MNRVENSLLAIPPRRVAGYLPGLHCASPLLLLYGVGIFGSVLFSLCLLGAVDFWAALPTAVLITLTALPAIAAFSMRGYDLFSPFQLVAGYFLVYYGARAAYLQLNSHAMPLGLLAYDDYVPTAAWLASLTFCVFTAGYTLARSRVPATYVLRMCPRLPRRAPVIRLATVAGIGLLAHVYILSYGVVVGRTYTQSGMREMTENPIPGWLPPCSGLVEIAFCVAIIYAMGADVPRRDRQVCKWFALICFVLIVLKTVSQGIREYVLLALALWVLCYHYRRRRVGIAMIAVALGCGMLVFPTVQVLRDTVVVRIGGTPKTVSDISGLVISSLEYFSSLSIQDSANLAMASVFDRSQGIDALSLVVKYTPERAPWGLGSTYLTIPVQLLVPRALWADKPILNAHQDFEHTYMGITFYAQASPHVFSDFYSNFAVFGLIVGALVFGVMFKYFYLLRMWSPHRKEVLLVYSYLILNGVHQLEAAFVAGAVIMVRAIIIVAIALCFLCAGQNRETPR